MPPDEALRQAAVFASGVLAIGDNRALRAIVDEAAALLHAPMAAVSIIDRDRQWFPAAVGLPGGTPRELSFCAYAILNPEEVLCVPDARVDARFAANPLVTHDPGIRFYAGAPLVDADGMALGALCAIDREPRASLTAAELTTLQELASKASQEIARAESCRSFDADAIEHIVAQMRGASKAGDEQLLLSLDRVVQLLEKRLELGLPAEWAKPA